MEYDKQVLRKEIECITSDIAIVWNEYQEAKAEYNHAFGKWISNLSKANYEAMLSAEAKKEKAWDKYDSLCAKRSELHRKQIKLYVA